MDAEGYLRKQGWKGTGHSLDVHGRGIKKPLLISHKQDQLGLGKKKAAHAVDDQWWMRAFDESLQNLGSGLQSTLSQVQVKGIHRGGLYGFFVKGEGLTGTITSAEESEGVSNDSAAASTSTPPTSASESESASISTSESSDDTESDSNASGASDSDAEMTKSKRVQMKRKRAADDDVPSRKKLKNEDGAATPVRNGDAETNTVLGPVGPDEWRKIRAVMSYIGDKVSSHTKANEKKGVYGLYLTSSQIEGRKKGQAHKLFDDPNNPGKKLTYKKAKFERQKLVRNAKKELTRDLVANAMLEGSLPNPKNWTKEEILEKYDQVERAVQVAERVHKKCLSVEKEQRKQEKKAALAEKQRIEAEQRAADKQAKLAAKLTAQQGVIDAHLASLSAEKKVDYEARAALKSQSLAEYALRRIEKKAAKRADKQAAKEASSNNADALPPNNDLFFVDTEGASSTALAQPTPTTKSTPTKPPRATIPYTPLPDGTCPLDPSLWSSHPIKSLPNPVRAARRKYLAQQRAARKLAAGKNPNKPTDTRKARKMRTIHQLTARHLSEAGIPGNATAEQKKVARAKAKKAVKVEKRAKKYGYEGAVAGKIVDKVKGRTRVSMRAKARNEEVRRAAGGE